jgi:ABC-type branched-subunit amino acid transport system permease subunit
MSRSLLSLTFALMVCVGISFFGENFLAANFAYYYDILISIGVNIILATSLNLVNGYTGQFSLGHAGFMAIGAYASASWSNNLDPFVFGLVGGSGNPVATNAATPWPLSGTMERGCFAMPSHQADASVVASVN